MPDDERTRSLEALTGSLKSSLDKTVKSVNPSEVHKSLGLIPNRIRRSIAETESSSLLTMFPKVAVAASLIFTLLVGQHSGILDCRDGFDNTAICSEEPALNVNGDLEVYLPDSSEDDSVKNLIASVEEDWTTNVMVIYVESENYNVTQKRILDEIDKVERELNYAMNDGGEEDDFIYVLSISTVIKEVNSSGGRVVKAFFSGLA